MSNDTQSAHDTAHELLVAAVQANDESHFTVAIDKAEEALELFWEVQEPCHGIAESLSVLGMAYAGSGDPDAARDARFNSLLNFIGDGDRDEVLALMDVARQSFEDGDLIAARIHWLAASAVFSQMAGDEDEEIAAEAVEMAAYCLMQADAYEHDEIVADLIEVEEVDLVETEA
jgi:translation elongation factor EF-1beta